MAIPRIRIDDTVYPPGFVPGESTSWNFRTFAKAKQKARGLGTGARVYRNFNQTKRAGPGWDDWWGDKKFWTWTGVKFDRAKETGAQISSSE